MLFIFLDYHNHTYVRTQVQNTVVLFVTLEFFYQTETSAIVYSIHAHNDNVPAPKNILSEESTVSSGEEGTYYADVIFTAWGHDGVCR